jgi:hypothetical protein
MRGDGCNKDFTVRDVNDKRLKAQIKPLGPS